MVPLTEMDAIARSAKADAEMRNVYAFLFRQPFSAENPACYPHGVLLKAVAMGDKNTFCEHVLDFKRRRTSEGSGWYDNDSLIFLLLVGCERFQVDRAFLDGILTARERNTNPIPKRITEVFRAIQRKEYGMEGQFSFIKIPFRDLTGEFTLSNEDAEKAYLELTRVGILEQLSPFLQLLAVRSFELILFHRKPRAYDNFDELIRGIETLKDHASLQQVCKIVWALPYKWLLVILLGVLPFTFGVGQKAYLLWHESFTMRSLPSKLSVTGCADAISSSFVSVRALAGQAIANRGAVSNTHQTTLALSTSRLAQAAPKFSVELSFSGLDLIDGHAILVQTRDGGNTETILPVQKNTESIRAFVPPSDADSYVVFVLTVRSSDQKSLDQMVSLATIRVLE